MAGEQSPPRDAWAALAALAPRALRAWWIGLLALFVGLVGTAGWVLSTKRIYRSEAVIVYERPIVASLGTFSTEGGSARQVGIQIRDMATSRQRLEKLIKEMKLYRATMSQRGLVEATEEMRKAISVTVREGYTFRVSYDSESREQAEQVLGRLVQSVVDEDTGRRERNAEQAKLFLDKERKHADVLLKEKEGALAAFLTKHPELAAEIASTGGTIRAADRERVTENPMEVASLELQAAQIESQIADASREGSAPPPEAVPDPFLSAARAGALAEQQSAERALLEKQARFTEEHPDVKLARWHFTQAQAKLRAAETALASARPMVRAGTGAKDSASTAARVAGLRRVLSAIRSQIGALRVRGSHRPVTKPGTQSVALDTEWTQLARSLTEARERQQHLEGKQFQAQLVATLVADRQAGGLTVADPPFRPQRPVAGGRSKIALLGGVASLALALLAVVVAGMFDRRLYDSGDVARVVGGDVIVVRAKLAGAKLAGKSA